MTRLDIKRELRRCDKETLIAWVMDRSIMAFYPDIELGRLRRLRGEAKLEQAKQRMLDASARMQAYAYDTSPRGQVRYYQAADDHEKASRAWDRALDEAYPRGESTR
jgi:hypothetical protein